MLDYIDRVILKYLFRNLDWFSANQVADRAGIVWTTARRHLEKLNDLGYVVKGYRKNRNYWKINE